MTWNPDDKADSTVGVADVHGIDGFFDVEQALGGSNLDLSAQAIPPDSLRHLERDINAALMRDGNLNDEEMHRIQMNHQNLPPMVLTAILNQAKVHNHGEDEVLKHHQEQAAAAEKERLAREAEPAIDIMGPLGAGSPSDAAPLAGGLAGLDGASLAGAAAALEGMTNINVSEAAAGLVSLSANESGVGTRGAGFGLGDMARFTAETLAGKNGNK